jgi:uncharacterized repeat protein (TIGR02059 family)
VAVTNATRDTVAPSLSTAAVEGSTLTLHFDGDLAGNAPGAAAFTVTVHGVARTVSGVALSGSTVTLSVSPAVAGNDTVVVSYAVPALDALHDAAGNGVAAFTSPVTNNTAVVAVTPPTTAPIPVTPAPFFVSASPADGSTVAAATSLSLTADKSVAWTHMSLTRPDGTVTALPDASGATATYAPGTSADGLYVVRGTITADGISVDVLTHFTIWSKPGGATSAPPVAKNAGGSAGSVASGDGSVVASWTPLTFGEPVVVELAPKVPTSVALPPSATVVDVTAFLRDSHRPVTALGDVLDVAFLHVPAGTQPVQSQDASSWANVAQLPTLQLPAGQREGWFRDSDGTVHVLTRHLTYFAMLVPQAQTKLALNLTTPRRLWLAGRTFMAVRIVVTAPARVTGSFVAPDGTVIPGQVIRTPTRHAGSTVLRVPLNVTKPGVYRLQVHADGIGQVVDRTARIRFFAERPASPIWQSSGPLKVAVVRGLKLNAANLGSGYHVDVVDDADLYSAVDPQDPHAATAVVVDLATVPLSSLASLHALLPELQIIGVAGDPATARAARAIGIRTLLAGPDRTPAVTRVVKTLLPRR